MLNYGQVYRVFEKKPRGECIYEGRSLGYDGNGGEYFAARISPEHVRRFSESEHRFALQESTGDGDYLGDD
jgi:hypothetical protein